MDRGVVLVEQDSVSLTVLAKNQYSSYNEGNTVTRGQEP